MFRGLTIAVVVPAFNERRTIERTISSVPRSIVDSVVVVDDGSDDGTAELLRFWRGGVLIRHRENRGVGAAIATGYRHVLDHGYDVAVVMAGDGQMDPDDLPALLRPIADGVADYAKGNRFRDPAVWRSMPPVRLVGNVALSVATRFVSGYWRVFDSQCGYTAITRQLLSRLELDQLFPRYGYPNDLLARLNVHDARVVDVPVKALYPEGWQSGIDPVRIVLPLSRLLWRSWRSRLKAQRPARVEASSFESRRAPESPGAQDPSAAPKKSVRERPTVRARAL